MVYRSKNNDYDSLRIERKLLLIFTQYFDKLNKWEAKSGVDVRYLDWKNQHKLFALRN